MTTLVLLLGLAAALGDLVGGAVVAAPRSIGDRTLKLLMALGAGNLLGVCLIELVPESIHQVGDAAPGVILAGYLLIHFFEHVFSPHLHFGEETHEEAAVTARLRSTAILGLSLHAFMDGVAISSAFLSSPALGVIVFAAIMLHKLPEGFTIASVMKATGAGRRGTMGAAAVLSVATFTGVAATGVVSGYSGYALALATGSVLYVGATDLMSEANKEFGLLNPLMVMVGIAMFLAIIFVARVAGIPV